MLFYQINNVSSSILLKNVKQNSDTIIQTKKKNHDLFVASDIIPYWLYKNKEPMSQWGITSFHCWPDHFITGKTDKQKIVISPVIWTTDYDD